MLALLLATAISAHADASFTVAAAPAQVITWLQANRDSVMACGHCHVLGRAGNRVYVSRDGTTIVLAESADIRTNWASYCTTLAGDTRKLRSWRMTSVVGAGPGGTRVVVRVNASLYGLGEATLQREIDRSLRQFERMLQTVFGRR